MANQNVVVGLDVGTTKVAVCVGQISEGLINILALTKVANSGLRKGVVVDIEECVSAISSAIEQAERISGVQLDSCVASIGSAESISTISKGVIAVSRPDGEINKLDVDRVIEAAKAIALPPNKEILHVIPRQFIIDGQEGVKDPNGMTGIRLETEVLVIGETSSCVKNLTKCITQSGLNLHNLSFSPIATAKALLNKKQKENGVILLDIGGGTTSIAIYEEGSIIHTGVIPIGSMHITNDLAIGLRIPLEAAEKIKLQYGNAVSADSKKNEMIDLAKFDPTEKQKIDKNIINEIIEARLKEMFSLIKDELKAIGKDGMLPAGVILTGGGSMLEGIIELAKSELHLPVQIGNCSANVTGMVDKLDHPVYATSIGLMLEGLEDQKPSYNPKFNLKVPKNLTSLSDKVKDILKQLLP